MMTEKSSLRIEQAPSSCGALNNRAPQECQHDGEAELGARLLNPLLKWPGGKRLLQLVIRNKIPAFNPAGLDEFFRRQSEKTNIRAKVVLDRIERLVQSLVVQELKQNFSADPEAW
jgi:hypothetical protein